MFIAIICDNNHRSVRLTVPWSDGFKWSTNVQVPCTNSIHCIEYNAENTMHNIHCIEINP